MKRIIAGAAAALALTAGLAMPAQASSLYTVFPVKQDGPGLKNWRCTDISQSPRWYGPWRVLKASAEIDCASYLSRP